MKAKRKEPKLLSIECDCNETRLINPMHTMKPRNVYNLTLLAP